MNSCRIIRFSPAIFFLAAILTGCAPAPRFTERTQREASKPAQTPPSSGAEAHSPAQKDGKRILLTLTGITSYYADDFHGKQTSNGEIYDMNSLTAAHRTFPFGTKVRVVNLENDKSVVVRINDRGPFHEGRILDLSLGAAKEIDLIRLGTARVRLEVLEWGNGK
jgi:rare lipoprotein A